MRKLIGTTDAYNNLSLSYRIIAKTVRINF